LKGYHTNLKQFDRLPDDRTELLGGVKVRRNAIPSYFTAEFIGLLNAWLNVKRWGMPHGGGWAEQPCQLMDVMSAFESAYNQWESKKYGNN
jgi:hypothetical protein